MSTQCLDEAPSVHRRKWCGMAIPLPSDLQNISTASHPEQNSAPCSGPPNPTRSNTGIQERLWCWQHCMQDGNSRHLEISRRYQETCGCVTIQDPFISYKERIYSKKHQRHWSPQSAPASRTLQRCGVEIPWNILTESHWFSSSTGHGWWRSHVSPNPFSNLSQCPSQLMLSALAPKCQGFDRNSAVKAIQWSFMIQFNWHLRHLAPV